MVCIKYQYTLVENIIKGNISVKNIDTGISIDAVIELLVNVDNLKVWKSFQSDLGIFGAKEAL